VMRHRHTNSRVRGQYRSRRAAAIGKSAITRSKLNPSAHSNLSHCTPHIDRTVSISARSFLIPAIISLAESCVRIAASLQSIIESRDPVFFEQTVQAAAADAEKLRCGTSWMPPNWKRRNC
jgi:hypothetical protein